MALLLADGSAADDAAPSLIDKLLKAGGVAGLIAILLVGWLMRSVETSQRDISTIQRETLSAVHDHETANQSARAVDDADRKIQRQFDYVQCLMLAKLSKSDPVLCEVGR